MNKKNIVLFLVAAGSLWAGFEWVQIIDSDPAQRGIVRQESAENLPVISEVRPADVLKRTQRLSHEALKKNYEHFMENRPAYLDGVDLPGRYSVDENGNLIVDAGYKEMLDYFLQGIGDMPFDKIYDLLAGSMIASLQEPALSQALALLDQYFSYIDAYDLWEKSFDQQNMLANDPAGMRDHLQQLEELRRQYLGDEAYEAFFAELDQVNSAYLEAQVALQQPGLTEDEKVAIRTHLSESLPPQVREAQAATMSLVTLTEKTRQLTQQGASAADIHQARVEMVGEAAAERLAQVDEEKRNWSRKRDQYKSLINETPGLNGMTDAERTSYLSDLAQRELGLTAGEIMRMQALDRIEAAETTLQ